MPQAPAERQRAYYDTFQTGMVTAVPPEEVPDTGVVRALNMVLDRQSNLKTRNGCFRKATNNNLTQSWLNLDAKRFTTDAGEDSLDFDATTNDRIPLGTPTKWVGEVSVDNGEGGSFAIEYKTECDASTVQERVLSMTDGSTEGSVWVGVQDGYHTFVINDGTDNRSYNAFDVDLIGWHHYAWTWDNYSSLLRFFMNGQLMRTWHAPNIDLSALTSTPGQQVFIGGIGTGANYSGTLQDIRVWAKHRTAAEIAANWETTTITGGNPDYLWYKLNEGTGTTVSATGTPAASLAASLDWTTLGGSEFTSGGGWSTTGPLANNDRSLGNLNAASGTTILDFGVGTSPTDVPTSTTAFDVSALDAYGGPHSVPEELDMGQVRAIDDVERITTSVYFKRAVGCEAVTLDADAQSPNADLYEANGAGLKVFLGRRNSSDNVTVRLYGDWHEQAASGQTFFGLGFDPTPNADVRPPGGKMVQQVGGSSLVTGSGRLYPLPEWGRYSIYDSSWVLEGTYWGYLFGGDLFLEIPENLEAGFPTLTPAYAVQADAPGSADYTTGSVDVSGRDTSVATTSADGFFLDEGDDWTLTASISDDVTSAGTGASLLMAYNSGTAITPERPVVTFGWDAGTVTKYDAGITMQARFTAGWSGTAPTLSGLENHDVDLVLQESVGGVWNNLGSANQDFSATTDLTMTINVPPGIYQGGALRVVATGGAAVYSGSGAATYRTIAPVAIEIDSRLVEYAVLDGTNAEINTTTNTNINYGIEESGDFFKLWLSIDTEDWDELQVSLIPFAPDMTFDKTSGTYVSGSVTDFGSDSRPLSGDLTTVAPVMLPYTGGWANDNTDREMWGLEVYPDEVRQGSVNWPTPLASSDLNADLADMGTEYTSVWEHLDPVLATRLYATGVNSALWNYSGTSQPKHFIWHYNTTTERWEAFQESAAYTAPNTTLNNIPPTWAEYDGYAFLAVPGAQLISIDNASVDPQYVNTSNTDNNTSVAYASNAPELYNLTVWNNRLYGAVWDSTNDVATSQVKGTKVGSPDDWADTGARAGSVTLDVAGSNSHPVTAMSVYEQKLFIFTRDSIYFLQAGQPNVDLMQYNLHQWSSEAGCLSHRTCKTVAGDLTFLSDEGILSLKSVSDQGNLERGLLSVALTEFDRLSGGYEAQAVAYIDPTNSRYHVAVPLDGGSKNTAMFVLDYTSQPAWTEWDGLIVGNDYKVLSHTSGEIGWTLVATKESLYDQFSHIQVYGDSTTRWSDDDRWYQTQVTTKAFTQGDEVLKKRYHRWFAKIRLEQDTLNLDGHYRFDLTAQRTQEFTLVSTGDSAVGDKYDEALYGTATYGGNPSTVRTYRYRMHGAQGRYAQSVQFNITNTSAQNEGWTLVALGFYFTAATSKYTDL